MVNLTNERTNFSFNGTIDTLKFEGSCTFTEGRVTDMNCSVRLAESTPADPSTAMPAGPMGDNYVGNLNYNRPSGASAADSNVNISYNCKESYLATLQAAIPSLLEDLNSKQTSN